MDTITTPTVVQSPPSISIQHAAQVSLTDRAPASVVHLVQYDTTVPIIAVTLTANGQLYTVPDGAAVNIRLAKPDGTYVYNPAYGLSADSQTVYIAVTVQMTVCIGKLSPVVEVVIDGGTAATGFFVLDIDTNPIPEDAIASTDEYQTIQQLAAQVASAAQIITDNLPGIQYVQENAANISAVAQNGANVTAVGQSISDVNAVGENISDVQTAAENLQAIRQAPTAAANAAQSAQRAQQYAESINPANFVQTSGLLNLVYPVGSIYMSTNDTSPAIFLGGSWAKIQDRFLLAASSSYTAGSTGGEATHTLTEAELPEISGSFGGTSSGNAWGVLGTSSGVFSRSDPIPAPTNTEKSSTNTRDATVNMSFGSGQAHNNMPPYLAVYVWKRTA